MTDDHDDLEMRFWGDCTRSLGEELKQQVYAREMGFPLVSTWRSPFNWDAQGRSVIDIGGGPVSMLLKMENLAVGTVVDPGDYPDWVRARYDAAGITLLSRAGEDLPQWMFVRKYALALIYNCLQHTSDPARIIANAHAVALELRMFEWIDIPPHPGHPQMLTAAALDEWAGRPGRVKQFDGENGCFGRAWILGAP